MRSKLPVDRSFADALPYGLFCGEGELFLIPGGLMVGWEIRGDDYESASRAQIDGACDQLAAAYAHLGDGDLTHMIFQRIPVPHYPQRHFPTRAARLIDDERRDAFEAGRYWKTLARFYLTHVPEPEIRFSSLRHSSLLPLRWGDRPGAPFSISFVSAREVSKMRSPVSSATSACRPPPCFKICIFAPPAWIIRCHYPPCRFT
jgi:hypothetical protein